MATEAVAEGVTPADGKPDGVHPAPAEPKQQMPPQDPPQATQIQQPEGMVTREELSDLLQKVRREEKDKLYPELDKLKAAKDTQDETIAKLEKKLESRQSKLEGVRAGKVEEVETINRELRELREQNQKLETAIDGVAESAAARVRASELAAYREKQIAKAGISHLPELVAGDSEEAIDAAIVAAKEKEAAIMERAREEARSQLAADLPTPISPDGSQARGPSPTVPPTKRVEVAQLQGDEYQKVRDQLLREAKQKAGLE